MEIRILTKDDIPEASLLANSVFEYCLRHTLMNQPELVEGFFYYASKANMWDMMHKNTVTMWGVFEDGVMAGMSAMQPEGHITMLYVYPYYQKRGYAKQLLLTMRTYAKTQYRYKRVSVNAMPSWTGGYFAKQRFTVLGNYGAGFQPYITMTAKTLDAPKYEIKPIPAPVLTAIVGGTMLFLSLISCIFLGIYFFF